MHEEQFRVMRDGTGFIAALDQSGGSTPKALATYGVPESAYADDAEMFDRIHEMRARIATSPSFTAERILAAILFENTMDRAIRGVSSADYLWTTERIVPFLKIDNGLADEADGVQVMKPMPRLDELLQKALSQPIFGTKARSFIKAANASGIGAVIDQQFEVANKVLERGLVPILEAEIDIHCPEKRSAEHLLLERILLGLDELDDERSVILKVSIPEVDDFYRDLMTHPKVVRVVALSGGYARDEACTRLARNHALIASFSRALTEGLRVDQSDEVFDATLDEAIAEIYAASRT